MDQQRAERVALLSKAAPIRQAARLKLVAASARISLGGKRAILTKGTFDILHAGHLAVLAYCASLKRALNGGAVVVVVESDASVRTRKGPKRPFQDENERALQIALLPWVDTVLIAARAELGRVISEVVPIAYVKGMDTALDAKVDSAQSVTLSISRNPELAHLQPEASAVVFMDDGTLSTSELVRRIVAAEAD